MRDWESLTHSKHFLKGFTGLLFVCWLIIWLVLQRSFNRQLFVRCVITDRCKWTLAQQSSPLLCFEWFHWWEMSISFCYEEDVHPCTVIFLVHWPKKKKRFLNHNVLKHLKYQQFHLYTAIWINGILPHDFFVTKFICI